MTNRFSCNHNQKVMPKIKFEKGENNNAAVLEKKIAPLKNKSPRYKVLLHNDPVNSMEYVTNALREVVPQLSEQDAISIMLEAHNTGAVSYTHLTLPTKA